MKNTAEEHAIVNPVLPGFHPDPSICRAGDTYYIATSTFTWFPGVRLHRSADLVHWEPLGYALGPRHLDLVGVDDNGGIWAPDLSYCDGRFYLVYTVNKNWVSAYKDCPNFLTTAPTIEGPWSDPVFLNASGFDPSLFHDDDGTKWLVNVLWDHRQGRNPFSAIVAQRYDPDQARLVGPVHRIFEGTGWGLTEGPHLYKRDGWYYLLCAEGGTGWNHQAVLARSRTVLGPYEPDPQGPFLTSRFDDTLPLQRAGHASLVETHDGRWYVAHLCGRPVMPQRKCILGRETALQEACWRDGFLRLAHGSSAPAVQTTAPGWPAQRPERTATDPLGRVEFGRCAVLPADFQSLRVPMTDDWCSLTARPGWLRLVGRDSLFSKHTQSLVAARITSLRSDVRTLVDVRPTTFQQAAGLVFFYDTTNYHYLRVTADDDGVPVVGITTCDAGEHIEYPHHDRRCGPGPVALRGVLRGDTLQFYVGDGADGWDPIGRPLDATILSDEHKCEVKFTGAMAGMCAQDLSGNRLPADFAWFEIAFLPA